MKTHMRQKYVVGNWKMHMTAFGAEQLAKGVIDGLAVAEDVTVILCPPFPYLALVGDMLKGSQVALGAQNMYPEAEGAFRRSYVRSLQDCKSFSALARPSNSVKPNKRRRYSTANSPQD